MRVVNQLSNEQAVLDVYKQFRTKLQKMGTFDEQLLPLNPTSVDEIGSLKILRDKAPDIVVQATKYTTVWSAEAIIILFITFFVLLEGSMLARRAVAIIGPSEEVQAKASAVLTEMANQVRTYLVWRTIINLGLAIVMGIIYNTFGLRPGVDLGDPAGDPELHPLPRSGAGQRAAVPRCVHSGGARGGVCDRGPFLVRRLDRGLS